MDSHDAVFDLATIAVVLATGADSLLSALGGAGLVNAADSFLVGMVSGDNLLATVTELLFIPLDRFEKTLQRAGRGFAL